MKKILFTATTALTALLMLSGICLADGVDYSAGVTNVADAWSVVSQYGWYWAGMLIVLGTGKVFLDKEHFLAQGRTLAILTGVIGTLGAVAQWKFGGAPPAGVLATAYGAFTLIWHPTVKKSTTIASLAVLLVALPLIASSSACSSSPKVTAIEHGLWDCTDPVRQEAVAALTPLAETGIQAAMSADGKLVDASKLKAMTSKANLMTEAGLLLFCAVSTATTNLLTAPTSQPGAAAAAGLVVDPNALRLAFEAIRPSGAKFRTIHGDI